MTKSLSEHNTTPKSKIPSFLLTFFTTFSINVPNLVEAKPKINNNVSVEKLNQIDKNYTQFLKDLRAEGEIQNVGFLIVDSKGVAGVCSGGVLPKLQKLISAEHCVFGTNIFTSEKPYSPATRLSRPIVTEYGNGGVITESLVYIDLNNPIVKKTITVLQDFDKVPKLRQMFGHNFKSTTTLIDQDNLVCEQFDVKNGKVGSFNGVRNSVQDQSLQDVFLKPQISKNGKLNYEPRVGNSGGLIYNWSKLNMDQSCLVGIVSAGYPSYQNFSGLNKFNILRTAKKPFVQTIPLRTK